VLAKTLRTVFLYTDLLLEEKYRYPLLNLTQVQVKVLQSDVYLKCLFLKALEYQE